MMLKNKQQNKNSHVDLSRDGLSIGDKTADGAIYVGISTVTDEKNNKVDFDLYMAAEDIRDVSNGNKPLKATWQKAATRLASTRNLHGRSASSYMTESELKKNPDQYDGGWMLPRFEELKVIKEAMNHPEIAASFNASATETANGSHWSCTEIESLKKETNGLFTQGRDSSYYVRDLNLRTGYESWDGKGHAECSVRPVYRVKR
jgi:hypothetical protein